MKKERRSQTCAALTKNKFLVMAPTGGGTDGRQDTADPVLYENSSAAKMVH